jgi:hypothetical protein
LDASESEERHAIGDILSLALFPSGTPALVTSLGSIGALLPAEAGIFVQIGVSITPGWTLLIGMPSPAAAHSIATAFANKRTPPLVAQ